MKKVLTFLSGLFKDEPGSQSMKRVCGLICVLVLCATMYHNSFSEEHVAPAPTLVNAVAALAFGCLGLTAVEKIFVKKEEKTEE